jgi:hypothetical protein
LTSVSFTYPLGACAPVSGIVSSAMASTAEPFAARAHPRLNSGLHLPASTECSREFVHSSLARSHPPCAH